MTPTRKRDEDRIPSKQYVGSTVFGVSRWCGVCKTAQKSEGGALVAGKDPLRGRWHCKSCLGKRS